MPLASLSLFSIVIFYSAARPKIGALVEERFVVEDPDRRKRIVSSILGGHHFHLTPAVPLPPALFFFPESSLRETVSRRLMRCGRKIGQNKARAAGHCSLIP